MQTSTVFWIVLAAVLSVALVYFQYYFRSKQKGLLRVLLSFLRFIGIFGIALLLINPKFSSVSYNLEKPNLALLIDNSTSIEEYGGKVKEIRTAFENNSELVDRFQITTYQLGKSLRLSDSLDFKDVQTNIQNPLSTLKDVYARRNTAIVLVSDGNQNIGRDYSLSTKENTPPIYTITVGDTTKYEDLSIGPINTNKYAFLNNKYPLETYVLYQGQGSVRAKVRIRVNDNPVYQETIDLSNNNNLHSLKTLLTANSVGIKSIKINIEPIVEERNIINNTRITSVEVIDEKTTIALVSDIVHPDLGALKKSIESNEQREVIIMKSSADVSDLEKADIFVLYQPSIAFKNIFEFIGQKRSNMFIITGIHTDLSFLNEVQSDFKIENGYPQQEIFGNLNNGFSKFEINDFMLTDFPPLESNSGPITFNGFNETLLGVTIKGLDMKSPMLTIYGEHTTKNALLTGEGFWKWRIQSYRSTGNFSNIDAFIGKLFRYLTGNNLKDRLNLTYSYNYEGSSSAYISATYFDETYIFDPNAQLDISVTNKETSIEKSMPMVLKNGYYEADLTSFVPGQYKFIVKVKGENSAETGAFTISNFDLEKQFVSSNYKKMQELAQNSGGTHSFSYEYEAIMAELISSNDFVPTQKSAENIVPLADFRILLGLIVLAFALEWFIRKYNGLI